MVANGVARELVARERGVASDGEVLVQWVEVWEKILQKKVMLEIINNRLTKLSHHSQWKDYTHRHNDDQIVAIQVPVSV